MTPRRISASGSEVKASILGATLVAAIFGLLFAFGVFSIGTEAGQRRHSPEPILQQAPIKIIEFDREAGEEVKRAIIVIGDGFGLGGLSSSSILVHGTKGGFVVESAPVVGLVRTTAEDALITDSAAAATALATGHKTNREVIAQSPEGARLTSIFELAEAAHLSTGVVTTSGAMDATPAAFMAHNRSRHNSAELLAEMLRGDFEVIVGAHWKTLDSEEVSGALSSLRQRGIKVITNQDDLVRQDEPFVALFDPRPEARNAGGPPLEVSVSTALRVLSKNPRGFILMAECEETDTAGHRNDIRTMEAAARELDDAVRAVVIYAAVTPGTLVIVTADHDTGGPSIIDGTPTGTPTIQWLTKNHTAIWVPLFAFGAGAERFSGVMDNTELPRRIAELLKIGELP